MNKGVEHNMKLSITKWGNSQGIRIPKQILKEANISAVDGTPIDVEVKNNEIIIKKPESDFAKLFDNFDLKNIIKKIQLKEIVKLIGENLLVMNINGNIFEKWG